MLQSMNKKTETMEQLDTILIAAYEKKASDVHLVVGSAPVFRVDGKLIPQKQASLAPQDTEQFAKTILSAGHVGDAGDRNGKLIFLMASLTLPDSA